MQAGYYFLPNWVTVEFLYSDGKNLKTLPKQSDQGARVWLRPGDEADRVTPALLVSAMSGYQGATGGFEFEWELRNLSPKMFQYLRTNMFGADKWGGKITAQTFNRLTGEWEVYQGWGKIKDIKADAEMALGGLDKVKIAFVNCTKILEAP